MVGQHVGKYRVIDRIGRGGMGTVYRATDETLRRDVAIKVLNSELSDPEVAKRFRAEAVTVARLSHPGIARIYELFEHKGEWLMVMEFVSGETLEQLVERAGSLDPIQAADVCMQALSALAHAHALGVVHRDLKPANIMINDTGAVVIMDFGIARVAGTEHLTNAGFMMGTPAYMAPEQVLGHEIDARSDLYAMGVVLYRLVTTTLPFKGETPFALVQAQVNNAPTPAATVRDGLPLWVDQILATALAKRPEDRFQSALEFREALAHATGGRASGALTPSRGSRVHAAAAASTDFTVLATPTPQLGMASTSVPTGTGSSAALSLSDGPPNAQDAAPAEPPSRGPLWAVAGAAAVFLVVAATFAWRSSVDSPVEPELTVSPPPAGAPPSSSRSTVTEPPAVVPPVTPTAAALPAPSTLAPPVAPTASPGPVAGAPRGGAGNRRPGVATNDPLLAVTDVRLLAVEGRRGRDEEVLLQFSGGQLSILGRRSGTTMLTVPYSTLLGATYVKARDPKWNAGFFAPPEDLDVGGVLRTSKHWLTLQGATSFIILRLEDSNVTRVLEAVEGRLGLRVVRPTSDDGN